MAGSSVEWSIPPVARAVSVLVWCFLLLTELGSDRQEDAEHVHNPSCLEKSSFGAAFSLELEGKWNILT